MKTAFYILIGFLTASLSAADLTQVTARIVNFQIDPYFATEAEILDDKGNTTGKTVFHGPCAIATFEIIKPEKEPEKSIIINFTDGRFQKGIKKKKMEKALSKKSVFTFKVPIDYFESGHSSISSRFVKDLKITHIKSLDTIPVSAPR